MGKNVFFFNSDFYQLVKKESTPTATTTTNSLKIQSFLLRYDFCHHQNLYERNL